LGGCALLPTAVCLVFQLACGAALAGRGAPPPDGDGIRLCGRLLDYRQCRGSLASSFTPCVGPERRSLGSIRVRA